jgi:hypothetical protein
LQLEYCMPISLVAAQELLLEIRSGVAWIEDDYYAGESRTFGYDSQKGEFYLQCIDTVVGSYNDTYYFQEDEFVKILQTYVIAT